MKLFKNNKIIVAFAVIVIGIVLGLLYSGDKNNSTNLSKPNKITSEEAKNIIDSEKDIVILDVRTKEEYSVEHIKNSLLIPVDSLKNEAEEKLKDKEQKILVYCRSGNRSKKATDILNSLGYSNVYDFGGINDWKYERVK